MTIYAKQNDEFLEANKLVEMIESKQTAISRGLGYDIISVEVNKETVPPVLRTEPRSIPSWAIALIVIVNSVIIISMLLIVLAILWKRYTR